MSNEIRTVDSGVRASVATTLSFMPRNFSELQQLSSAIASSDLAPNNYKGKPANVMIAIIMGAEVGLKPMQAVQGIAIINSKPCIWGDAMLALIQSSGLLERFEESDDGETATCIVKRKGFKEHVTTFSNADAEKAGLLNKSGPWRQYTQRMRQMRARAFALRDQFADVLNGLSSVEEVRDYSVIEVEGGEQKRNRIVEEEQIYIDIDEIVKPISECKTLRELRSVYKEVYSAYKNDANLIKAINAKKDEIKQDIVDKYIDALCSSEDMQTLARLHSCFVSDCKSAKDKQSLEQIESIFIRQRQNIEFFEGEQEVV